MHLSIFNFITENPSSIAMADLMHSSLRENNLKRLFYVPYLLVIDTFGISEFGSNERIVSVQRLLKIAQQFGFNVHVTSLETPENVQIVGSGDIHFEYSLPNAEETLRLKESINAIKDNTARQDLIENILAQILMKTAKTFDCHKVFVSDSATLLAVKLMSGRNITVTYPICDDCLAKLIFVLY